MSENPRADVPLALVVEDDEILRKLLCQILQNAGFEVVGVRDGESAMAFLNESLMRTSIVVTDVFIPDPDGVALLDFIRSKTSMPILVISGYTSARESVLMRSGPCDFLKKPFGPNEFLAAVKTLCEKDPNRRPES